MATNPIQTAFAGEISKRLRARWDAPLLSKGLDYCENFRPTPQGSLLMRGGSVKVNTVAAAPRLFPFRAADGKEYVIEATTAQVRLYSLATRALVNTQANLAVNGGFDDKSSWGTEGPEAPSGASWTYVDGTAKLPNAYPGACFVFQNMVAVSGQNYSLRFRHRGDGNLVAKIAKTGEPATLYAEETFACADYWQEKTINFVPGDNAITLTISTSGDAGDRFIDDVWVTSAAQVTFLASPWNAAQLAEVNFDSEPAKSRLVFTQKDVGVYVFTLAPFGVWDLRAAQFTGKPDSWRAGNWPRRIEVGFQGRMILASTPDEPNVVWGSRSGVPFDFTIPDPITAKDAYEWTISLKGGINWMRGQKTLLLGDEVIEHSARGSSGIITGTDIDVTDQSAFGSAPVQALHLGDQVAFVSRDRKSLRVTSYSQEANGWVSSALTFIAEHITKEKIRNIHLARSPDPLLIIEKEDGALVACTYDRSQEVIAWWRVAMASVASAAVADSDNGSELWCAVSRPGGYVIEVLPLYETEVFLDSSVTGVFVPESTPPEVEPTDARKAFDHVSDGTQVRVVIEGVYLGTFTVDGGLVKVPPEYAGESGTVGIAFKAKAVTLPKNVKGGKVRSAKLGVVLNDSALPTLNGVRPPERDTSIPWDEATGRATGKVEVGGKLGWDGEGKVTIEQDLPFRTEILALFENTQANDL